jgi:Flp pilus assembly protein TadG
VSIVYLLIVFGTMEYGRMIFAYNIVSTASRDGARWASVRGTGGRTVASAANIQSYVASRSMGYLQPADVEVSWNPVGSGLTPDNVAGNTITVTARYRFTPIVPLLPQATRNLSSTARMVISR